MEATTLQRLGTGFSALKEPVSLLHVPGRLRHKYNVNTLEGLYSRPCRPHSQAPQITAILKTQSAAFILVTDKSTFIKHWGFEARGAGSWPVGQLSLWSSKASKLGLGLAALRTWDVNTGAGMALDRGSMAPTWGLRIKPSLFTERLAPLFPFQWCLHQLPHACS